MAQWETGKQTFKPSTYSSGYFIMIPLKKNGFLVWYNKFFLRLQIQFNKITKCYLRQEEDLVQPYFFLTTIILTQYGWYSLIKHWDIFGTFFFLMKCLQSSAPKIVCSNVPPPSISHPWVVPIHMILGLVSGTKRICYDSFKVKF